MAAGGSLLDQEAAIGLGLQRRTQAAVYATRFEQEQ